MHKPGATRLNESHIAELPSLARYMVKEPFDKLRNHENESTCSKNIESQSVSDATQS